MKFVASLIAIAMLFGMLIFAVACGTARATPPTAAGAADGLNTFIFVYSDN